MSDPRPRWQLESIPDLLGTVPYLLGFHPSDSGVIVGIHDQRIHLVARLDLPDAGIQRRGAPAPADETAAVLHQIAAECTAHHVTDLVVLGYGEPAQVVALFDVASAVYTVRGLTVMQLVRVTGGQYIEHDPQQPDEMGDAVPFDRYAGTAVSGAPHPPVADRATLAAAVAPVESGAAAMADAITAATARLATGASERFRLGRTAVEGAVRVSERNGTLDDEAAANLLVLLRAVKIRDHAFDCTDSDDQRHLRLWLDLTRRAAPGYVAAPACLAAYAAWRTHQPMLARLAVDRALHDDPGNELATMLDLILRIGMPPELAPQITARRRATGTQQ